MRGSDETRHETICSVDAELFESLEAAIAFVAERGGGVVYTELADSLLAHMISLPDNVRLKKSRTDRGKASGIGRKKPRPGLTP